MSKIIGIKLTAILNTSLTKLMEFLLAKAIGKEKSRLVATAQE